jgi:myo-inositol-1(or 4)-monophosphatase
MSKYLLACERAARAAGSVLLEWRGHFTVREKGPADLVTEADFAAQNVVRRILQSEFPAIDFVGEESTIAERELAYSRTRWIVDPLDGTTNYVHQLPGWCVSIALVEDENILVGCIYDPLSDTVYLAEAGEGAFRNGERLRTSGTTSLRDSLVALSFPATASRSSPEVECFLGMLPHVQAFRRLGSAALNLCHIAAGQMDANWSATIHAWDVAAGILLVREAGGVVTNLFGEPFALSGHSIAAAANATLHAEFVACLGNAWPTTTP